MTLNREALKNQALAFRAGAPKGTIETSLEINPDVVQEHLGQLEEMIKEFASNGEMSVDYKFNENPIEVLRTVARTFKEQNPELMVIESSGDNRIIISWDGNNYV